MVSSHCLTVTTALRRSQGQHKKLESEALFLFPMTWARDEQHEKKSVAEEGT